MEELFIENFSKQQKYSQPVIKNFGEMDKEELLAENFYKQEKHTQTVSNLNSAPSEIEDQNFPKKDDISMLEMVTFLDRLEKEIEKEYLDFADYRFIFNKIRTEFKKKSVKEVIELLDNLEELLDLGLPSIILKKNLEAN